MRWPKLVVWVRLSVVFAILLSTWATLEVTSPSPALANHTTIKLPFLGTGAWYAWEGYNVSPVIDGTHWDCDPNTGFDIPSQSIPCRPLYIYKYSFDLRRVDEQTAWQPVLAPADGVICWIDRLGFGGGAISFGDGYVFAYFHTRIAGGLAPGQSVQRGQFLGVVAPPGEAGNGGIAHLHINLWRSNDCGGNSRVTEPFTGDHKLNGYDFPALADSVQNQHVDKRMTSTNTVTGLTRPTVPSLFGPAEGSTTVTATPLLDWGVSTRAVEYQVWIDGGAIKGPWIEGREWRPPDLTPGRHTWQVRGRNPLATGSLSPRKSLIVPANVASLDISPDAGMVDTELTVTGDGYAAGESVALTWDSADGQLLKTVTATGAGAIATTLDVPRTIKGEHRLISAGLASGRYASAPFVVEEARTIIQPSRGAVGTRVAISAFGFGEEEPVFIAWDGKILDFGDTSADVNGTYFANTTVPSLPAGKHTILLIGEVSDQKGTATFTVEPTSSIEPRSGVAGTTIALRGKGWPARSPVTITWGPSGATPVTVCTTTSSAKGTFVCRFNAPDDPAGVLYRVVAKSGPYTRLRTFRLTGVTSADIEPSPTPTASATPTSTPTLAPEPTRGAPTETAIPTVESSPPTELSPEPTLEPTAAPAEPTVEITQAPPEGSPAA